MIQSSCNTCTSTSRERPAMNRLVRPAHDRGSPSLCCRGRSRPRGDWSSAGRWSYAQLDRPWRRGRRTRSWRWSVRAGDRVAGDDQPNDLGVILASTVPMRPRARWWVGINAEPSRAAGEAVPRRRCSFVARCCRATPPPADQVVRRWRARCSPRRGRTGERTTLQPRRRALTTPVPRAMSTRTRPRGIACTRVARRGYPKGAVHSQHNLLVPGAECLQRAAASCGGTSLRGGDFLGASTILARRRCSIRR